MQYSSQDSIGSTNHTNHITVTETVLGMKLELEVQLYKGMAFVSLYLLPTSLRDSPYF